MVIAVVVIEIIACSYIPDMYLGKEDLSEEDQTSINNLNAEVLHQLKAKDTAFSMGTLMLVLSHRAYARKLL